MTKTDQAAADRAMKRATAKAIRMIRAGCERRDYEAVITAAIITAAVLMEPVQ